jgi:hypothetical protein
VVRLGWRPFLAPFAQAAGALEDDGSDREELRVAEVLAVGAVRLV